MFSLLKYFLSLSSITGVKSREREVDVEDGVGEAPRGALGCPRAFHFRLLSMFHCEENSQAHGNQSGMLIG